MKKQFLSFIPMLAFLIGLPGCQQNAPEENVTPVDTATVYNPDTTIQTEYTIFLYGNAGGAMDDCIENSWKAIMPVLKDRSVRFVSCYKYGKPSEACIRSMSAFSSASAFSLVAGSFFRSRISLMSFSPCWRVAR